MKMLHGLALVLALALAPAAPSLGCGGCYINDTIVDLTVMPAMPSIEVSATPVGSCNGGYGITIANYATDALVLAGTTIPAGSSRTFAEETGDINCPDDTCTLVGTLGAAAVTVRWVIQPG